MRSSALPQLVVLRVEPNAGHELPEGEAHLAGLLAQRRNLDEPLDGRPLERVEHLGELAGVSLEPREGLQRLHRGGPRAGHLEQAFEPGHRVPLERGGVQRDGIRRHRVARISASRSWPRGHRHRADGVRGLGGRLARERLVERGEGDVARAGLDELLGCFDEAGVALGPQPGEAAAAQVHLGGELRVAGVREQLREVLERLGVMRLDREQVVPQDDGAAGLAQLLAQQRHEAQQRAQLIGALDAL